jgi:hypothetical protein
MGISPYTMYKNIRSAQNWVKARLKVFSTAFEGRHNGGAAIYADVSKVFKSDNEDSSVNVDGSYMSSTIEDPENRQHHTTKLSNVVHGGSKALRVNNTTDHRVKVASYGKLYAHRGLINHESQMRIVSDDIPWSKIEGSRNVNRGLVQMMSSSVKGERASSANRKLRQSSTGDVERFAGDREMKVGNRSNNTVTKDIMALLGITANEVKFLESQKGNNRSTAQRELANLHKMATQVHALPAHARLQMRKELLLKSAGGGLIRPDGQMIRGARNQVVLNPKIVNFMKLSTRNIKAKGDTDTRKGLGRSLGDPDNKLDHLLSNTSLFVTKSASRNTEDIENNRQSQLDQEEKFKRTKETKTRSYASLSRKAAQLEKNRKRAGHDQRVRLAQQTQARKNMGIGVKDPHQTLMKTQVDNDFGANKYINRHIGLIGTKNMRRYMDTDHYSRDNMNEIGDIDHGARKNPKNIT